MTIKTFGSVESARTKLEEAIKQQEFSAPFLDYIEGTGIDDMHKHGVDFFAHSAYADVTLRTQARDYDELRSLVALFPPMTTVKVKDYTTSFKPHKGKLSELKGKAEWIEPLMLEVNASTNTGVRHKIEWFHDSPHGVIEVSVNVWHITYPARMTSRDGWTGQDIARNHGVWVMARKVAGMFSNVTKYSTGSQDTAHAIYWNQLGTFIHTEDQYPLFAEYMFYMFNSDC